MPDKLPDNSMTRNEFLRRASGMSLGAAASSLSGSAHADTPGRYRTLGRTGLRVTAVGFGTVHADRPNVCARALDRGITFYDTGRMYSNGRNEEMIGKVLGSRRKDVVIQSKFAGGLIRDAGAIRKSIEESLRALRTDYLDIVLMHSISSEDELMSGAAKEALTKAKEAGKIRFSGFSSHSGTAWRLLDKATSDGFFDVALVPYNHAGHFDHTVYRGFHVDWNQTELEKAMERASAAGMGIAAMKTCSAGPYASEPGGKATFPEGLAWNLRNRNIATMAVCMSSYQEVDEDTAVMG